jgi:hypothetical protein
VNRNRGDPVAAEELGREIGVGDGVGVRETSRLISRLRHRQFGVLVTTSHLDTQAYREIREDGHPVVIIAGHDIVDILKNSELDTVSQSSIIWTSVTRLETRTGPGSYSPRSTIAATGPPPSGP